jgi:hypothetical protein
VGGPCLFVLVLGESVPSLWWNYPLSYVTVESANDTSLDNWTASLSLDTELISTDYI